MRSEKLWTPKRREDDNFLFFLMNSEYGASVCGDRSLLQPAVARLTTKGTGKGKKRRELKGVAKMESTAVAGSLGVAPLAGVDEHLEPRSGLRSCWIPILGHVRQLPFEDAALGVGHECQMASVCCAE